MRPVIAVRLLALCLVGCGASPGGAETDDARSVRVDPRATRDDTGTTAEGSGATTDGERPDASGARCPGTFAAAEAMGVDCTSAANRGLECRYDAGNCWCGIEQRCSGVAVQPDEVYPTQWICEAAPPAVRPDGCPGPQPSTGSACSQPGQSCGYGDCGGVVLRCDGGRWVTERIIPPPP